MTHVFTNKPNEVEEYSLEVEDFMGKKKPHFKNENPKYHNM